MSRVVSDIYTDTNGNKHTLTSQYVSDTEEIFSVEEKIESMMNGKKVITENNTPYYNGSAGDTEYTVYYEDKTDKPIQTGTIWCDKGDIKRDDYVLYDADGNSIGDGEKSYNSNGTLAQEEYHLYTEKEMVLLRMPKMEQKLIIIHKKIPMMAVLMKVLFHMTLVVMQEKINMK